MLKAAAARPLFATVVPVGTVLVAPDQPLSSVSIAAIDPCGAGDGSDGVAPGWDTVTWNPGRVIVRETPFKAVTVTPLPKAKNTLSFPMLRSISTTPPWIPMEADAVFTVIVLSWLLTLPAAKRNTPRVRLAANLAVPAFGL